MNNHYEVVVGNIGTVYAGSSLDAALKMFREYKDQSLSGVGRAGREDVTVLKNGDVRWEFNGQRGKVVR